MSEKILVTGGAGFIGTHLVRKLLKDGNEIVVLDNLSTGNINNVPFDVKFIQGDIRDKDTVSLALDGVEKVFHLAAELGVDRILKMTDGAMRDVDYYGTKALLDACKDSDVKNILFASTSEVYGEYEMNDLPMAEDDDFKPDTPYGQAKLDAEVLCQMFAKETGKSVICVRYFNVYGANQTLNGYAIPNFINAALRDKIIKIHGEGKQIRDFTYIDDAVNMTVEVCQRKFSGEVFNIGTGTYMNMIELASVIKNLCDSKSIIEFVPPRRPTDLHNKYADGSKIMHHTGLKAKMDMTRGLEITIRSYRDQMVMGVMMPELKHTIEHGKTVA